MVESTNKANEIKSVAESTNIVKIEKKKTPSAKLGKTYKDSSVKIQILELIEQGRKVFLV